MAYSYRTFPPAYLLVCVCPCVSVSPVHCGKTADQMWMQFGVLGWMCPAMRQVIGFGIGPREGVILGANLGHSVVTNEDFMQRHDPVTKLLCADFFYFILYYIRLSFLKLFFVCFLVLSTR